jgi:hypothetical protein
MMPQSFLLDVDMDIRRHSLLGVPFGRIHESYLRKIFFCFHEDMYTSGFLIFSSNSVSQRFLDSGTKTKNKNGVLHKKESKDSPQSYKIEIVLPNKRL